MATKPANEKLYAMIVAQARAKFATYPSPGASHWVHKQYIQHGGQFITTTNIDKTKKMLAKQFEAKKRKHLEEKKGGSKRGKDKGKD